MKCGPGCAMRRLGLSVCLHIGKGWHCRDEKVSNKGDDEKGKQETTRGCGKRRRVVAQEKGEGRRMGEWRGKNRREGRREEGVSQSCLSRLWSVWTACFLSQTGLPAGSVLTDEMAHAAVTREPGSPAKWGQVAGQPPWSEEFRPSSPKYAMKLSWDGFASHWSRGPFWRNALRLTHGQVRWPLLRSG